MTESWPYRFNARVLVHLNGGFTRVSVDLPGYQGGREQDVPTEVIPAHLRALGSSFILVFEDMRPENRGKKKERANFEGAFSVEELGART